MNKGADLAYIPTNVAGFDDALLAQGRGHLMRYAGAGVKSITPAELAVHKAKGMKLGLYYQDGPATAVVAGGRAKGVADATTALAKLKELGLPASAPVVFALDPKLPVDNYQDAAVFYPYLAGLTETLGRKPWAYGTRTVVEQLLDAGLVAGVVQCWAYSGGIVEPRAAVVQNPGGVSGTALGVGVDLLDIPGAFPDVMNPPIGGTMLNIVLLPSNQLNLEGADPNPTAGPTYEQDTWLRAANWASDEFAKQGHLCVVEYVRGVGTATTDELNQMCDRGVAQFAAWAGDKRAVSFHSNTGSGVLYMYPLYGRAGSEAWAEGIAKIAGPRTGMTYRNGTLRSLMFFSHFNYLGDNRALLMEIGEHQTAKDAQYLWLYGEFIGRMMARSIILGCGYALASDGPMAAGVPVPPGAAFDKYRPGVVPSYPAWTRLLKVVAPHMKGADVKYAQLKLIRAGFSCGPWGADGDYGNGTATATKLFQAAKKLLVTGGVDRATYDALVAV